MVLGEETQITAGKEPPPVHSHFPNVGANVLRVRNTRLFFFFFVKTLIQIPEGNSGVKMLVCEMEVVMSLYHL